MICITGAGGTVGSELIRQLASAKVLFRAAYFTSEKAKKAQDNGIDAVVIDYGDPDTLKKAFYGCDRMFLLGPNVPDQTRLELNAVNAAKVSGVKYVVKQSVLGAKKEAFSLAKVHRPVEKALESSGLAWTFLRPNSFMQNIVTYMIGSIQADSAFYSASGKARISHVDVRDIAAVAVKALTQGGHEGKAYTLTGPESLTYDEVADEISKVVGRRIHHISLPASSLKQGMLDDGLPEEIADRMLDLERYFREDQACFVTDDINHVTGKNSIPLQDYLSTAFAVR